MKSKVDETVMETHNRYDEFVREQYIIDLDLGDKVRIQILDENDNLLDEKFFIAKYVNCHINCQFQDKGVKK